MSARNVLPRIGLLSAGQMGAAIGAVLVRYGGLTVLTALDGRSDATRDRAAQAGLIDVGDIATLAREADVILSVLRPTGAEGAASAVAAAIQESSRTPIFVDCNAITPAAAQRFEAMMTAAGGHFVDAAIQSPPPKGPGLLLYASGQQAERIAFLRDHGIDLRLLDGPVGQASALDLVVGGTSKLFEAAAAQIFLAARHWALEDVLEERVARILSGVAHLAPLMPSRAARWAEEMEETSHFMDEIGLPGTIFTGAADVLTLIARSGAVRRSDAIDWPQGQRDVIGLIARDLEQAGLLPQPRSTRQGTDE
jgi:hypothetical protein